jgi:hypothetical protein
MKFLTESETEKPCRWLSQLKPYKPQETLPAYASMREHLVQHYALMAMNKGSIDHARYMTRQLESEWAGLGISIAKRIKEFRNEKNAYSTNTK